MTSLPSGTVTFLFTDIEDSTSLWERHPEAMNSAVARHYGILRQAIQANHGHIVKTTGDGCHAAFERAVDAIRTTIQAQYEFQISESLENPEVSIHVRMGVHTGEAELREGDYYGQALNRAARIMSAGSGGQILLSEVTAQVAGEHLPADVSLLDLGEHHLRGLLRSEHIFQLVAPKLQREFPPLKSIARKTNNLPAHLTSFIGREREMHAAAALLASSRLLTLIGPGGTGKTRLSLQLAFEKLTDFKDGAWIVELAPISNPANILSSIVGVFDLREVREVSLLDILLDYLRARELLLILDNCEHLVEASAQVADQLLQECPHLKIIASSREALGIVGETVFRVPSLKDEEATRLFVDRAAKVEPRFHLTGENASFVAQICSRLDGIPLAIELAAARVKLFTPEQIAQRLDDRFKLLTGGSRTALPRQQTLRALIDWSYQSLNETEQRSLRRLSVFSGGWTFEGAEAVLGEADAMDGLMGLVNKSLVNVEGEGHGSRYRFLETIRQYAMEKLLESGEAVEARDHHLDFMLQIAELAEQRMFGSESLEWLDQMEVEHDNLRAALEWAAAAQIEKAVRLALAIGGYWTSRDYNSEARDWCRIILERSEPLTGMEADRAKLYALWGWSAITTGNHKEGRAVSQTGLELARRVDDPQSIARLLIVQGLSLTFIGDFSVALESLEESIAITRRDKLNGELAMALTAHSQAAYYGRKDFSVIRDQLQEATKLAGEAGFQWASSMSKYGLGIMAGRLGNLETARAYMNESAELAARFGNRRIGFSSRSELAHLLRENGLLDEAQEIYGEVIPGWRELGHRAAIAHELECIAFILKRRGEPERAATLLGAAEALREVIDTDMTNVERVEYEKELSALRAGMAETDFQKAWSRGRELTMDEAIDLALNNS